MSEDGKMTLGHKRLRRKITRELKKHIPHAKLLPGDMWMTPVVDMATGRTSYLQLPAIILGIGEITPPWDEEYAISVDAFLREFEDMKERRGPFAEGGPLCEAASAEPDDDSPGRVPRDG